MHSPDARLLSLTTVALCACHGAGQSRATSTSTRADSAAAMVSATATTVARIGPAIVCESVAVLWRATGRATVFVTDTVARVQTTDTTERNRGRFFTNVQGCATSANAPGGIDGAKDAKLYWKTSAQRGWADFPALDADGPDGNTRTRQRDDIHCQVEESYGGGDDTDSSYVPSPRLREVTICWQTVS